LDAEKENKSFLKAKTTMQQVLIKKKPYNTSDTWQIVV
jgi:hypothetical protein